MRKKRLVMCLALATGLVWAGCSDDSSPRPDSAVDMGVTDTSTGDGGIKPDSAPPPKGLHEWCDINAQPCEQGLLCVAGMCQTPCDPKKGKTGNADCPDATDWCDGTLGTVAVCRVKCDPQKGKGANTTCPKGTHCELSALYDPGYCALTAHPPKDGPKQLGEDCTDGYPGPSQCDGSKDLFCYDPTAGMTGFFLFAPKLCAKACDPRAGTASNPGCGSDETCEEDTTSFAQGRCTPKPSKQLGEWCNKTTMRCKSPLVCIDDICRTACDEKKGVSDNPDCGGAGNKYFCFSSLTASGCVEKCDPDNGMVANAACPARTYCRYDSSEKKTYTPGYCVGLMPPRVGSKKAGESCSAKKKSEYCGSDLGCVGMENKCVKTCDPKSSTPNAPCGSDTCVEATYLSAGGYCASPGPKKAGELCNWTDERCESGLVCVGFCTKACERHKNVGFVNPACSGQSCTSFSVQSGFAAPAGCDIGCDPSKGEFGNPDCPTGAACYSVIPGVWEFCIGFSSPPPGTGKKGDACSEDKPCDGDNFVECDESGVAASHKCVQGCDPSKGEDNNPRCASGEKCQSGVFTFLGGVCLAAATKTQALGDWCNAYDKRCKDNLTCIYNKCFKDCDDAKGKENNPDCPSPQGDFACVEWKAGYESYGTVCRKNCDSTAGQVPNPKCDVGSGCKVADPESPGQGYCLPTTAPQVGAEKLGDPCDSAAPESQCMQNLACSEVKTCEQGCDPTQKKMGCKEGMTCAGSWYSSSGGYCL